MAYKVKLSNTTNNSISLNYRLPANMGGNNMPLAVIIQPRALLNEITFETEEVYKEVKKQNELFFKKGYLLEGNVKEKEIISKSDEISKDKNTNIKNKVDKTTDELKSSADNVNATLEITEEKASAKNNKR